MLTACGIETFKLRSSSDTEASFQLQQCLPLAVLKRRIITTTHFTIMRVATVLTACGIETESLLRSIFPRHIVATVLTACGIETAVYFN